MTIAISIETLNRLAPRPSGLRERDRAKAAIWDGYTQAIVKLWPTFDMHSRLEAVHMLAQWAHESDGFTIVWEDMSYSPQRILQIFGKGKHSAAVTSVEVGSLAHRPYALAERVYGVGNPRKAKELGNDAPGDGYNHRGCGIGQITGKTDHQRLIGGDYSPEGLIKAAYREWEEKRCYVPALQDDIVSVTKKINGGLNGLAERRSYLARAKRIWEDDESAPPAPVPQVEKPKELAKASRKISLLQRIERWLGLSGVGSFGLLSADKLGLAKTWVQDVSQMLRDNAVLLVIAGCVAGWALSRVLQALIVEDHNAGRYIPSGDERTDDLETESEV